MMSKQIKWGYLLLLSLIWGSSFILIKKGLVGLTAFQLGSLRIIFAALFLLVIGFRSLMKIPHHQWRYIALTSLFGTFIPAYLFAIAQTQIDSSISSILNSLTPLNTLLIGVLFFRLDFRRNQIFGVLIGLVGSALLIWNGAVHHPNQNYYYAFLVLIASICYATNVNLIKKYLSDLPPLSITTGNFLVLLFPALAVLYSTDFFAMTYGVEVQESVLYILILGVLGTEMPISFSLNSFRFRRLFCDFGYIFDSSGSFLLGNVRPRVVNACAAFWRLYCFGWGVFIGQKISVL